MTDIHALPPLLKRKRKRLGRGAGSGKGKTSGRGTKGQKSRGKSPKNASVMGAFVLRRLPLIRGKRRNLPVSVSPVIVNVKDFACLSAHAVVDVDLLVRHKLVLGERAAVYGVKILGDGTLTIPLDVRLPCSGGALKKILAAGGRVCPG